MKDEFSESTAREMAGKMVLAVIREKPFLKATTRPEWAALDRLVAALDAADYWRGEGWSNVEPPEEPPQTLAGKRRHVREMLEHLNVYMDDDDSHVSAEKVFISTFKATERGGIERVYKVAALCSPEELEELGEYHGAAGDYHHVRSRELHDALRARQRGGEKTFSLPEFYMQELTEETMLQVWPNLDEEGRGWVIAIGVKLHQGTSKLLERVDHEHREGAISTSEQARECIRRGMDALWHEIAVDLSRRMECGEDEAEQFVDQPVFRFYSSEFAAVLGNQKDDEFGWTLDEHLRFVGDERALD